MSHMRTTIRQGLVTLLTGLPSTANRVFASRVYPLQQKWELPGLLVAMGAEGIDTEMMWPPRAQVRSIRVYVTLCLRARDTLDDDIDVMLAEIEPALAMPASTDAIAGVKGITLVEIQAPKFSAEGDQPMASVACSLDVQYATEEGAPEASI